MWLKKGKFKENELVLDERGQPVINKKGEYKCYNTDERKAKFIDTRDLKSIAKNEQKTEILLRAIIQLNKNRGIPLSLENIDNGSRGFFSQTISDDDKGRISVSQNLDIADKVKTAIHETVHSQLHSKEEIANTANAIGKNVSDVSRRDKELQAEATAYLVCKHYGIDSSDYSFNYLASWSADRNVEDLHRSLNLVWNQSRKLLTQLKEELNKMGFDENIEPIHTNVSEQEKKQLIADEKGYIFKTSEVINNSLSEAKNDLTIVQDERQKNIIQEQVDILIQQNKLLNQINEHLGSYNGTVSEQKIIQANKDKIDILSKRFDELSTERVGRIQELQESQKAEIKDLYTKEPYKAIKLLQENNAVLQKLSDSEIKCIAISPYIKEKFGRDIGNEKFAVNAVSQISNSKEVMAKNGVFVEVNYCEHWDDNISFTKGTVLHPSTANRMIKEADNNVHRLKDIAEKNGEYYPYVKLSLTVYKVDKNDVQAVKMRIDLGGENHLQDLKSALKYELGNQINAQTFLKECEKAISENVKDLYREATLIDIDTQSISSWEQDIEKEKEVDIPETEYEHSTEQQNYENMEFPDINITGGE